MKDTYTSFDPYIHRARVYCSDCDKLVNNLNFKKAVKKEVIETKQKFNNKVNGLVDRLENTTSSTLLELDESNIDIILQIKDYL